MAKMIPKKILFDQSQAEVKLFDALRGSLSDDYTVLHHVQWLQKNPGRMSRDGETDFIVLHPKLGALTVEVKGGEVRYEATSARWFSKSRRGIQSPVKDPFTQGRDSAHSLRRYLQELPGFPPKWGPVGYAVAFPDAALLSQPLPHTDPVLILEASQISNGEVLLSRIEEIFAWYAGEQRRASQAGVSRIVEALAHDLEIRQPLSLVLEEADREIIRLSERQYGILNTLAANRRVAVSGPAGSGKTLIAVEKARRLALEGLRVLLVCYNRPLADFIANLPVVEEESRLSCFNFHRLCQIMAQRAGVQIGDHDGWSAPFDLFPKLLAAATETLPALFDALVVDEGQDFEADWWLPLLMLQSDPDDGVFYVFYDDNQSIYRRPRGLPAGLVEARLWENWRNTKPIHDVVAPFYRGEIVDCLGPDGPPVEILLATRDQLKKELSRVLHRLVAEEGVDPGEVVVLTPLSLTKSQLTGKLGQFDLTAYPTSKHDIKVSSIWRFKGLDARVVVVGEVSRGLDEGFRKLMYVACSRARTLLILLLGNPEAVAQLKSAASGDGISPASSPLAPTTQAISERVADVLADLRRVRVRQGGRPIETALREIQVQVLKLRSAVRDLRDIEAKRSLSRHIKTLEREFRETRRELF